MQTLPLPFVPATWIAFSCDCGLPRSANSRRILPYNICDMLMG